MTQWAARIGVMGVLLAVLGACAPRVMTPGPALHTSSLGADFFLTADGVRLPLRAWQSETPATAVIVALHGFNDYSNFFDAAGTWLAQQGVSSYAYDQRGFGAGAHVGMWAGWPAMVADLKAVSDAVAARHPDAPIYVLGESMGGAVTLAAAASAIPPDVAGYILSGPAVWGRSTMPWYQTSALWLGAHTVPWLKVSGRGLNLWPSDNVDMLRALGRDPLVIKHTRIDAVWGLTNLMDTALAAAATLDQPTLVLYGERDEIIPPQAFRKMAASFNAKPKHPRTIALYREGWHMLLRDRQAEIVWADVVAWMQKGIPPLPSKADARAHDCLGKTASGDCFPARIGTPLDNK